MTRRYSGGLVRAVPVVVSAVNGTSGVFTVSEAMNYLAAFKWPINNLGQTFTFTGSSTWASSGVTLIDYLVVGGGGGGGSGVRSPASSYNFAGGGGGAGGVRMGTNFPVTPGQIYTITVGAGGSAAGRLTCSSFPTRPECGIEWYNFKFWLSTK